MITVPEERQLTVDVDFTLSAWNTIATHEVLTVTGLNRIRFVVECTGNVAGATATIQLGHEALTSAYIGATTATDLVANELWYDTTPTTQEDAYGVAIFDRVVNELDIGYQIVTAALTGGSLRFHVFWTPLESGANVIAGSGGTL